MHSTAWLAIDRFKQIKWRTDMCHGLSIEVAIAGRLAERSIEIIERREAEIARRMNALFQALGYRRTG